MSCKHEQDDMGGGSELSKVKGELGEEQWS